ncbi:hypothetical protein AWC38_SpisGene21000 [Stylophora pistillata]|uniref:Peptidase aspartic putative domain-containing protein n=1 Tax=Stylophora pistillata TaxID=50429 RepID=A0A2B4R8Z1_STYPI|nr:hypothetical protein AWC38_SpisGene21000 [Stylophora pistillata]
MIVIFSTITSSLELAHDEERRFATPSNDVALLFVDVRGKTLSRGTDKGMAYAKFKAHKFSYLNISNIGSDYVMKGSECGLACVNIPLCFSFNLAALQDVIGKLLCELLPSDIYNNSEKFVANHSHHHFSITTLMNAPRTHTLAMSKLIVQILWDPTYAPVSQPIIEMEKHADKLYGRFLRLAFKDGVDGGFKTPSEIDKVEIETWTSRQIEYLLRRRAPFKGVVTKNSKKAKDNISKNGSKTVLRTVKVRILQALQDASKTKEDVITLQSDDVTKRAESEEWLDNLRDEVEDIVDSSEEYLESCTDESSRVSEESSVATDVVSEVDDKGRKKLTPKLVVKDFDPEETKGNEENEPSEDGLDSKDFDRLFKGIKKPALTVFSGDKNLYHDWKAQFEIFVDRMKAPAKTKMMMLKNSLTGKPLRVVERLGYTSKHYQTALQKLDQKNGGEERLLQRYLEAILHASPVEEANLKELEIFSDRLIDIVAKLEDSDQHQEQAGVSALYIVVQQKLAESLLITYQEWLHRRPRKDGLSLFSKWLQKQVVILRKSEKLKRKQRKRQRFERRSNPPERVDAAVETRNAFSDSELAGDVVLRTVPVWLIGSEGQRVQVNAFLDDGSDSTYVRDDIATALDLKAKAQTPTLTTLTDSCIPLTGKTVSLTIKSIDGEAQAIVEAWTLNEMCQDLSIPDWNEHKIKWEHLKNIPFPKAPGRKTIDTLIESDHPELTLALRECYGPIGTPVARKTPLGWTYVGRLPSIRSAKRITYARNFRIQTLHEVRLDEKLREMWEIDSLGVRNSDDNQLNQEEILAMSKVENSRKWTGGRYEVAIPWKEETPSLPDNR